MNSDRVSLLCAVLGSALKVSTEMKGEKSAKFSDALQQVRVIPLRSEMTKDEYESSYYSEEEMKRFQVEIVETIKTSKQRVESDNLNKNEREEEICLRGIEHLASPEVLRSRGEVKAAVIRAVLRDQEQRRGGGRRCDPEATRMASERLSAGSRDLALMAGASDAALVRLERAKTQELASAPAGGASSPASIIATMRTFRPPRPVLPLDSDALYDMLGRALEISRSSAPPPSGQVDAAIAAGADRRRAGSWPVAHTARDGRRNNNSSRVVGRYWANRRRQGATANGSPPLKLA